MTGLIDCRVARVSLSLGTPELAPKFLLAGHDVLNETEAEAIKLGNFTTTRLYNTARISATEDLNIRAKIFGVRPYILH